jgi:hypothetical protein
MIKKPNRQAERLLGTIGALCSALWAFKGVLIMIDWVSRAQTAATIGLYLWVFGTPLGFALEFIVLVCSLFYATRLEHSREIEETPLVFLAYSEPAQPKRNRTWIKLSFAVMSVSALSAGLIFIQYRDRYRAMATSKPEAVSSPPIKEATPLAQSDKQLPLKKEDPSRDRGLVYIRNYDGGPAAIPRYFKSQPTHRYSGSSVLHHNETDNRQACEQKRCKGPCARDSLVAAGPVAITIEKTVR